ncbi:MAG: hypothetical protein B5M54_10325 [Candidatus Aminicenantes bacterium 4484_214]|nr:MAG: hypothetical protein B5M54_10325 [Candidatus Aminicenantes bacterium 4484_214]
MTCKKIKKLINESLERRLSLKEKKQLEDHLATCKDCRQFSRELRQLVGAAASLPEMEPSPFLWSKIQAALQEQEKSTASREGVASRSFFPPAFLRQPAVMKVALSCLLVVVILAGGLFLWRETGLPPFASKSRGPEYALNKLVEARHHYQKAIEALTAAVEVEESNLDPEVLTELRKSLAVIEATIISYERAVRANPRDIETQTELLMAYQRKIDLLEATLSREAPFWE